VDEARPAARAVFTARRRRAADARDARRQLQNLQYSGAIQAAEKRLEAATVDDLLAAAGRAAQLAAAADGAAGDARSQRQRDTPSRR
jgi:hypothetical protein